jgi:hypothetical protein
MKWSTYIARLMTLIFGVTPPQPKDETRYALTVIGLGIATVIGTVVVFEILVPLTLGK